MIEVCGVSKHYGDTTAVDDLSFRVPSGQVTGFLGPNGSGKSTTMRMILGLDKPDSGFVRVDNKRYVDQQLPLTRVGSLLEARSVHPGRSAINHLRFLATSNGIPKSRVTEVLELVGLESVEKKRAGSFSLGMGQRLGIASALLGDPPILLLDEPVNGLDPEGIIWVRTLLRDLAAEGRAVLVSSHLMAEMALTADQLVVVGRGRLIAETTVADFVASAGGERVLVRATHIERLERALADLNPHRHELDGLWIDGTSPAEIGERALEAQIPLTELSPQAPSLEEAFMSLTSAEVVFHGRQLDEPDRQTPPVQQTVSADAPAPASLHSTDTPVTKPSRQRTSTFTDLRHGIQSEWRKFVSLRSTIWALLLTFGIVVAFGGIGAYGTTLRWESFSGLRKAAFDPTAQALGGLFFGQLVLGALGVLVLSGEYSSGSIRATMSALPRRGRVLVSKVTVLATSALVVSLATMFAAFFFTQWMLRSIEVQDTLASPNTMRAVVGAALFLVAVALLGLGLAAILRHTAGAISTLFGLLLVLPLLVNFLPEEWQAEINPFLPVIAGLRIVQTIPVVPGFDAWISLLLMFGYAAIALVLGAVLLRRRDV